LTEQTNYIKKRIKCASLQILVIFQLDIFQLVKQRTNEIVYATDDRKPNP
jgi:hypothetical protein